MSLKDNYQSSLVLRNIMMNMPGHVYWKSLDGVYLGCNDKQAKTLGLEFGDQVIGKTDFDLPWGQKSAQEFHKNDQRVMEQGEAEIVEEKISDNGDTVLSIKAPIKNEVGVILGILGISIDITEKKRTEELLKEKEVAEKNAALMNILSSSVAHEVRTPLSIIQINTNLMQMLEVENFIPSKQKKASFLLRTKNICQAVKECSQVIDMLLVKLKKISTVVSPAEKKELLILCSIEDTIQKALSEYPFREGEKVNYIKNAGFSYQGDERLIKHVLFNLIRNSLRAIEGAQKGEIFIEYKTGDEFNHLIFRDTASGISQEYLPKIFNKFETADEVHSGTGLGLAFCKLVMESFGGTIECRSEVNKFTEFTLSFPPAELAMIS
jgi:PAS domain S-box-containing protein